MSETQPTFGERVRDAAERFGEWLGETLAGPQPELVPVPVRQQPARPHPGRRRPPRRR